MTTYNWKFYTPPDPRGYKHNDVMILPDGSHWILSEGEGWSRMFMALDPTTGAVTGLVGPSGSDFLVVSSNAPNNADGRPNGTIYIQTA